MRNVLLYQLLLYNRPSQNFVAYNSSSANSGFSEWVGWFFYYTLVLLSWSLSYLFGQLVGLLLAR